MNVIPATHHDIILVSYKTKFERNNKPLTFKYHNFKNINWDELEKAVNQLNWSIFFRENDLNKKDNFFNTQYFALYEESVPLVEVKIKGQEN